MDGHNIEEELLQEFGGTSPNNLLEIVKENTVEDEEPMLLQSSTYLDLDTIETFINANRNNFTIFSVNIQSLNAKFTELTILIKYLNERFKFNFSVICLQECWITEEMDKSQLTIPNYKLVPKGKECCGHGGLATYVYDEYKGKEINFYKKSPYKLWEGQFVTITCE